LSNAIELNRISHAYLFSGTRGVGKTTTARIFAKAINCLKGPIPEPCDQCNFCEEIRLGSCIDVREIDGASNNGVAEARELIETIKYVASASRYKVYIIDEVHMLSKSAFNALLKTLEEPPPGVVFLFATTELSKIPETILSRCQCFEFKPLSNKQILQQLEIICAQEGIQTNGLSLEKIAKTGAGSMRDAQSLLDQVIAYCGNKIEISSVEEILGIVGRVTIEEIVDSLIKKDLARIISKVQVIVAEGKDLNFLCRDLAEYCRNLMMIKLSDKPKVILDIQVCDLPVLQKQASAFHTDEIQQMFNVLSRTESEMKRSSLAQMIFEMAMLRLADVRPFKQVDEMIKAINSMPDHPPLQTKTNERIDSSLPNNPVDYNKDWQRIKQEICARKPVFTHYLAQCEVIKLDELNLSLGFKDKITLDQVRDSENFNLLNDVVKSIFNREIKIELSLNSKVTIPIKNIAVSNKKKTENINKSEAEIIQDALDVFGGVVIK
jgi:DNA polymerase-3 subunit gamma/tau